MLEWIIRNKEWLFSGVLVAVMGFFLRQIFFKTSGNNQNIKSGKNSKNIQIQNTNGNVKIED